MASVQQSAQSSPEPDSLASVPPVPASPSASVGSRRRTRLIGAAVAVPCWALIAIAIWLRPDSRGYNTHTQLGLSPCALPATWGVPCPTCGMTTAFAHMAQGELAAGLRVQAFGAVLFVVMVVAAVVGTLQVALVANLLGRLRFRTWYLWVVLVFFLAAWAGKIVIERPGA